MDLISEAKISTKSASNEIEKLFDAMRQRKELANNVRTVKIQLKKNGRFSDLYASGEKILSLNVDGNGQMMLNLTNIKGSNKLFKSVIAPLMNVLNDYFKDSNISISNTKDANDGVTFNISKKIYVSSKQIQDKPVSTGQIIHFTSIKHGRFKIQ